MSQSNPAYSYKQISASTNVKPASGILGGIFVSSASNTPQITVYDSASTGTGTTIVAQITPVSATWYPMPFGFSSGCYVVIGGTVQCTVAVA